MTGESFLERERTSGEADGKIAANYAQVPEIHELRLTSRLRIHGERVRGCSLVSA